MKIANLRLDDENTLLLDGGRIRVVVLETKGKRIRLGVIGEVEMRRGRTPRVDTTEPISVES